MILVASQRYASTVSNAQCCLSILFILDYWVKNVWPHCSLKNREAIQVSSLILACFLQVISHFPFYNFSVHFAVPLKFLCNP